MVVKGFERNIEILFVATEGLGKVGGRAQQKPAQALAILGVELSNHLALHLIPERRNNIESRGRKRSVFDPIGCRSSPAGNLGRFWRFRSGNKDPLCGLHSARPLLLSEKAADTAARLFNKRS